MKKFELGHGHMYMTGKLEYGYRDRVLACGLPVANYTVMMYLLCVILHYFGIVLGKSKTIIFCTLLG